MLLEETNAAGAALADYIYLGGQPVAVLNVSGSAFYYLHTDHLGTPQLATDSKQAKAWTYQYAPFADAATVTGTITQNLRLPGQYFDSETGWNHNGFRDYAPQLGRYIEPDPLGRLGSGNNLYAYVGDDPIDFIDPLGLKCKCSGPPLADDPTNLRLFPTEVQPGNFEIKYRLRAVNGVSLPNGTWWVFEHQTQSGGGRFPFAPGNNISPYPSDPLNQQNQFPDSLGGGVLDSVQTFTISPEKKYNSDCQFPVIIHYGNGQDYGSQHIWQPSANQPVLINGFSQIPGLPGPLRGEY